MGYTAFLELAERGDHAAAAQLEDEIERRGLEREYTQALLTILADGSEAAADSTHITQMEAWELLRATPEQRAQAFLKAIEG